MTEKGISNMQVRYINKKRIMKYLYENNGATKHNISNSLKLSMPTVSLIIKELYSKGIVLEKGTLESSGGRKPSIIALNYDAKLSIGLEFSNNYIKMAIIDLEENILHYCSLNLKFENTEGYYKLLGESVQNFITENNIEKDKILGIGIAVPGIVNEEKKMIEYMPTTNVKNVLFSEFEKHLHYNARFGNEANLAGLAEIWQIDKIDSAVYLSINKGFGGAIIIDNKIYTGKNSRSGEFGHMTILENGKLCSCGKNGCLEAYCSTKELTGDEFNDIDDFFLMLKSGNKLCTEKWNSYLDNIAVGINNIRTVFGCDIIIGGEISPFLRQYKAELIQRLCDKNSFGDNSEYVYFSKLNGKAACVGAALQFVEEYLYK